MSELLAVPSPQSTSRAGTHAGRRRDIERPPLRLLPDSDDVCQGEDEPRNEGSAGPVGREALRLDTSDTSGSRFRGGLAGGALRRVRAYIEAHLGERILLDELACQAGVSRFHFARQFRLATGESPMGYLRRTRIERSKSILQTRDTTIAEVAASLGFSDQSHFTRIFGRLVGVSPGSFARCDEWSSDAVGGGGARRLGLR